MKKKLPPLRAIKHPFASLAFLVVVILTMAFQNVHAQSQFTASATTINGTSEPKSDPAYVTNGNFTVTVVNDPFCTGTYTINASPVGSSGPGGSTPPHTTITTYIGFGAGDRYFGNAGAGQYTVTVTETAGTCSPTYSPNPVIFSVTVPEGLLSCPDDIVVDNDPGECSAVVEYDPYLTVGAVTLTYSFEFEGNVVDSGTGTGSGSVFPVGTTSVTIQAINSTGNESCTFTVTVEDNEGPVVTNAAELDWTFSCKGEVPAPNPDVIEFSNNCSPSVVIIPLGDLVTLGDCLHDYVIERIYLLFGMDGNLTTYTQTITVKDEEVPELIGTLPGGPSTECTPVDPPLVSEIAALYQDNCSGVVEVELIISSTYATDCGWAATYTYTVADICGNTVTPVIVFTGADTEAPALISEAEDCSSLDEAGINLCFAEAEGYGISTLAAQVAALYEDNCGTVTATLTNGNDAVTGDDCGWVAMYIFEVSDGCSNSVTCTVTISGSDQTPPTGSNIADLLMVDACFDEAELAAPFSAEIAITGYSDNCGGAVSATYTSHQLTGDDCFWTITYTFSVWDVCDNELPAQTYAVSGYNTTPPSLVDTPYAGEHQVNACYDAALYAAPFDAVLAVTGYEAHCGATVSAVLTFTEQTGDDCAWIITYTFTVEDGCGLGLASQTYTNSGGNENPPIVDYCPTNQEVDVDDSACNFTVPDTSWDAAFYDYCYGLLPAKNGIGQFNGFGGSITPTYTLSGATTGTGTSLVSVTFNIGVTDVLWTATDDCGNTATCTFEVTVLPTSLSGVASYYNFFGDDIPMSAATVQLLGDGDVLIDQTLTGNDGYYEFTDQDNLKDTRKVRISTGVAHGGLSATDALAVQRIATSLPVSYWLPVNFLNEVGNVNVQGGVNIIDAVRIIDRLLYPANPDFFFEDETQAEPRPLRDWAFYAPDLNLGQGVVFTYAAANAGTIDYTLSFCELDIWGRTYGDVLGNYNPSFPVLAKSANRLTTGEVMPVQPGAEFELPVRIIDGMEVSAMTLVMDYDAEKLELTGVRTDLPGMRFVIEAGQVRIAWTQLDPVYLYPGDAVVRLVVRTLTEVTQGDALLSLGALTGFASADAIPVEDFELSVNSIDNTLTVTGIDTPSQYGVNLEAYPNPFRHELNLKYAIPESGNVRISIVNILGAEVAKLVDRQHEAGVFNYTFNPEGASMEYGVYFVRFEMAGETIQTSRIVKLVYMR